MNGKSIKQAYIDNCTFVKTILMLCVIIGHCANFWNGAWFTLIIPRYSSNIIAVISVWLNSFHIYAFTLVSGYLYYFLKYEKNKYHEVVPFVLIKVKRLLIPYCFCAFIWVVPITAYLYSFSLKDIFEKYILCTSPSQLWFLWMLFWVFIIVQLISELLENDSFAIIISMFSWGTGLIGEMIFPNVFCIWTAFTYLPFFILGMKLREKEDLFLWRMPSGGGIFSNTNYTFYYLVYIIYQSRYHCKNHFFRIELCSSCFWSVSSIFCA